MKDMLKTAVDFVKKNKTYPTLVEMERMGITRAMIRTEYNTLAELYDAVFLKCRDVIIDLERSTPVLRNLTRYKRFVITTATIGGTVDENALRSINTYCQKFDAAMVVLVAKGPGKSVSTILDSKLPSNSICIEEINLNSNIRLLPFLQSASKTNPTTGLPRVGKRNGSTIVAASTQRLVYTATGINKFPHATMSTGTICLPKYDTSTVTGYTANHDHTMGAIIVEIVDDQLFHFREIEFDSLGRFVDLGTYIQGNKISQMSPSAMILGDWHAGKTNPLVEVASYDVTKKLKIPEWVIHDLFDGDSITHHDQHKLLLLAKKAKESRLNLEQELRITAEDLKQMNAILKRVTIVKSNHDEHLDRYLDEGRFMKHPYNAALSMELATAMLDGKSPVQYAVNKFAGPLKNLKWLNRDESHIIAGHECGAHGDKGANGSRGSPAALENAYGKVIYGHAHTPDRLRNARRVGTSTDLSPDYGTGPSSWMNTHCLVYPNGQAQMINFIDGEYTTRKL